MTDWLDEYIIQLYAEEKPEIDPVIEELEIIQDQLAGLLHQQDTICGYLEKGIYSSEMFQNRNASLSKEITRLQETEEKLLRKRESVETGSEKGDGLQNTGWKIKCTHLSQTAKSNLIRKMAFG